MNSTETSLIKIAPSSQHVYDELSTPSLRLFRLEKAASGELSIQLSTFAIDKDFPDYIALSYTWEPRFPLHVAQVNDGELSIGHNLWKALWTLIPLSRTFFWADQICINQQRTHELNHQVGLMHQIYHFATTVLIWLGDADQGSDSAMQFISYIAAGNCDRPSGLCKCKHIERMDDVAEDTCRHHFKACIGVEGQTGYKFQSSIATSIRQLF
ncbi:heterokaryon incompatibility protein-domain-containing protein [Leptodontidium sp. 2 PMI_412]|nr:heterokaryon incompatibility protein-domain-containing protein [Leptodontidium sp. 2 PMI_412]